MRKLLRPIMRCFGYDLRRWDGTGDAYLVQKKLIARRTPIIFDGGAAIGQITRRYRRLFPLATIHAFEPYPQAFEELRQSIASDSRIHPHPLALAEAPGRATLHVNASMFTNSLLPTDARSGQFWPGKLETQGRIEIETVTLDGFCRQHDIAAIDILKLDLQGMEYAALQGARDLLSRQAITLVYTEVILGPSYRGQHKLHEYLALMDSFGYQLFDLYHPVKRRMQLVQADLIFVPAA